MAQQGGRIDFQIGFKADKSGIQDLKKSLQQIQKIKPANFDGTNQDLQEVKSTAKEVEAALSKAFNPNINSINLKTFDNQLKASGKTINDIYTSFSKAGAQGQVAFSQMARSVLTTNQQLKETHSIVNQMGTTFVNTIKWGIASSIMNTFTSSVQGAFTYVESLEKSLTNIRIVTGDSQEKMEQFADSANRAAQELGRSTMDYSKAALTFYQQGLGEEDVQARTEAVLKAQNITGAGSQMADYLTSVWNGYKVANEQAQVYVDKLAAVADRSASDMSQLAIGMSKVASTANTMGVNVDQLNAQLATVIATTRQAPEAVGTAFKTIYTRLNDIKTGADGAEVSLGNYSSKMAELGFNVLDATGHLRDTGQVMQEIGGRWEDLTREQQVYLATTMGGQRQVNQLMALFDNWTTYSELLNTSLESEGTLAQKNSVYLESLGAKMEQLGAAGERVKASLIDSESFGNVIELLTAGTNLLGGFIQAIGGGGTALLGLGGIATQVFSGVISKEINNAIVNYQNMKSNIEQVQIEIQKTQEFARSQGFSDGAIQQMINEKQKIQQLYAVMSEQEKQSYNNVVNSIGATKDQIIVLQEKVAKAKEFNDILKQASIGEGSTLKQQQEAVKKGLEEIIESMKEFDAVAASNKEKDIFTSGLIEQFQMLEYYIGTKLPKSFEPYFQKIKELIKQREELKKSISELNNAEVIDTKKLEEAKSKLKDLNKEIREAVENALPEVQQTLQFSIDFKTNTQQLEQARQKLVELQNETARLQHQMSQALTVKGIVEGIGSLGRMTSAIMALTNGVKGLFDSSIPPMERFGKFIVSIGYSLPMLLKDYKGLVTWTKALSAATIQSTTVSQAKKKVDQAQNILNEKKAITNALLKTQTETGIVDEVALTAAKEAEKTATEDLTFAQYQLNLAMEANPIGLIITGIAILVGAIAGAVAIYDALTMSTKQADEALQNFNNKINETNSKIKDYSSKIGDLSNAEEEWDSLSEKAGQYNTTINNLTEDEKQRYYELSNLIAQYNPLAVAGYDEQGNAIIRNNEALKETIELLKQKRQEEINSTYSGQDFDKAEEARQVKAKEINKKRPDGENITDSLEKTSIDVSRYLKSYGNNLNKDLKETSDRLSEIVAGGRESILKNKEELVNIFSELQLRKEDLPDIGVFLLDGYVDNLQTSVEDFNNKQQEVDEQLKGIISDHEKAVIGVLQTDLDGNSVYNAAQQAGMTAISAIALDYLKGMEKFNADGTLKDSQVLAKQIETNLLEPLYDLFKTEDAEGKNLYQNLVDSILNDQKLQEGDFDSLKQKNDYLTNLIEQFIQENLKNIQKLKGPAREGLKNTLSQIFGIEDLDIDFDTGKVEDVITSKVDTLKERISEKVRKDNIQLMPSKEEISALLPSDITDEELDNITERIEALIDKTGSWRQALALAIKDSTALSNLNTNLDTVGLLNKQAAGDKLSDKEAGALSDGLDVLKRSYSDLQDEVETLNSEWLQGTSQYESALRKVKGALLETLVQSVAEVEGEEQRLHKQEEVNDSIINMTTSMEDLQQAWFALNLEGQQNALIKVAASYESCKDEIQAYTLALKGNSDEEKAAAANDLARATYSAERGQQYGIEAERISELADEYARLASEGQAEYAGLNENAELAADAATRYIRLNDAIADLQKNYDSMTQLLNAFASDSQNLGDIIADNSEAYASLKKDLAGIIDVSEDMIDQDWGDWISDNADLIKQAMDGSQEAIDALRESAAQKIELDIGDNVNIDGLLSKLDESYDSVADWANSLPEGQIKGDNLDFIQSLTDALNEAGYTADQIEDIFSGMGIDIDLADQVADAMNEATEVAEEGAKNVADAQTNAGTSVETQSSTATSEDVKQDTEIDANLNEVSGTVDVPTYRPTVGPWGVFYDYAGTESHAVRTYGVSIDTKPVEEKETKETTATALKVIGATKSSGGRVSHKNKSGGNKKSSGGKGGKGKKGKGGKGKKGSTKTPKAQKPITDKPDRYHDVNLKLKDIDNDLGKLQKKQQKLTGKDLLKNLNEQLKLLEKQVATYKEKIQLEKQQANQIRNRLKKQGATFGPDGNISNYNKVLSDALNEYNATIAKYNKMSAEEQQKNKDMLEKAKQKYENLKKDIQRYDKIISEEIPGLEKAVQEAIDKQTQINIQKFKVKVDLEMDMSEAQREFNQFVKKVKKQLRDDDVLGNAQAYLKDYSSYYKGGYDVIQALTDQIRNTRNQINNIDKQGSSSVYGKDRAAAIKDLQEYTKELMSNLSDIEDVVANIKNTIFDAIDKAQDAFDEQKKEYEYIADLIEHNQKIVQLLYGEDAYNQLQEYYKLQQKNNNNQLDFLRRQKEMWYSRMEAERKRMNNLTEGTNAWKEANDRFEEYKRHWMDSLDEINGQIQNSIENLIDKYTNAVDKIFLAFENNITGGKGLENISEEWQLIGKQADQYLDKVNSMYEIDKLENAYRDAIDDNDGNLKAQQSLNNLMNEQLKYLKDKDKLTQYDVDRANALLQIEIKRLALEQARQSKTKLRLRRDSQGNYTYQYTADEDATRQAQQELADAENSLYNLTKQSYKNNLDDYYDTAEEMNEKIRDVYKDTTLSAEEQNQKIAMIYEYYGDIINGLTQQNEDLKKFMMEDTFNEMAKMYDTNVQNFKNMTDEEKDIFMNDMVPYWKSSIQDMADTFAGAGGFGPITQDLFKDLIDNSKDYQDSLDEIGKVANVSLEQIKNATDINIQRAESLLEKNDKLINSYNTEMAKVQEVINQVNALTNAYQKAKNEAIAATQAAYNFNQQDNAKTVSSLINNKKTAGDAQYRKAASFDTGGYTGDWGDMGKAAILHEKEIVLNSYDTTNLLSAVKITRTLDNIISNFAMKPFTLGNVISNANSSTEGMEQNITIHADFPNVTERSEIEAAFNNLVNKASQYAFRNKR